MNFNIHKNKSCIVLKYRFKNDISEIQYRNRIICSTRQKHSSLNEITVTLIMFLEVDRLGVSLCNVHLQQ